MIVAMVTPFPQSSGQINGGVEAAAHNLVSGLNTIKELTLHIITPGLGKPIHDAANVIRHFFPVSPWLGNLTNHGYEKFWIKKALKKINPDIIHFQDHVFYMPLDKKWKIPTLVTLHGFGSQEKQFAVGWLDGLRKNILKFYERRALKQMTHVISIASNIPIQLKAYKQLTVHSIANAVAKTFFDLKDRAKAFNLLMVGFVYPLKNIEQCLKALSRLKQEQIHIQLKIAGAIIDQDYYQELLDLIKASGLEPDVTFLGQLDEKRLRAAYEEATVLVMTSKQENAPVVIQQAMAAGKSVLANHVGGISDLVQDGKTGYLINCGDEQALVEKIKILRSNPEQCRQWGAFARSIARQNFLPSQIGNKTYQLYQDLIKQRPIDGSA